MYRETKEELEIPLRSAVPVRILIGVSDGFRFFAYCSLEDVADFWSHLELKDTYSPFQSLAWAQSLVRAEADDVNSGARKHIFVVGFSGSEPVMLLPLSINRGILGARLNWLGEKISDYNGMIVDRSRLSIVPDLPLCKVTNMLRVAFPEIQAAHFIRIPVDRFEIDRTREAGSTTIIAEFKSHAVTLDRSWAALYRGIRSGKSRQRLQSKYRSLKKLGKVQFRQVRDTGERVALARQVLDWKSAQLTSSGRRDPFKRGGKSTANRLTIENAVECEKRSSLKMFGLFLDDKPVAGILAFCSGQTFYYFISACSPQIDSKYSIGVQLLLKTLELAARSGKKRYDFLIGDEPYKRDWCDTEIPLIAYARPFSFRGRLICAGLKLRLKVKKLVLGSKLLSDLGRIALKFRHQGPKFLISSVKARVGVFPRSRRSQLQDGSDKADRRTKTMEDARHV